MLKGMLFSVVLLTTAFSVCAQEEEEQNPEAGFRFSPDMKLNLGSLEDLQLNLGDEEGGDAEDRMRLSSFKLDGFKMPINDGLRFRELKLGDFEDGLNFGDGLEVEDTLGFGDEFDREMDGERSKEENSNERPNRKFYFP